MPKVSVGGKLTTPPTPPTPSVQPTQPAAPRVRNYQALTDTEAATLRQQQDSSYNGTVTAAVKMYIAGKPNTPAANFDGAGHSMAQTMNYLLEQGVDLANANVAQINRQYGLRLDARKMTSMIYTDSVMAAGAHALGKDITLTRYAHDDVLTNEFGLKNWDKMSATQLSQALVGGTFTSKSFTSTSYDARKSPFSGGSNIGGGREVVFNIKAAGETRVLMGNKAQAEIILNKGTQFRVTGVQYTGQVATPRMKSRAVRQIQIDLETI